MKRPLGLFIAALMVFTALARADIVEVRGHGILNGEVVSDDGRKIKFKDAKGKIHTLEKKDVDYMQIDKKDTGKPGAVNFTRTLSGVFTQAFETVLKAPEALKNTADGITQSITGTIGKPLQRSQVQAGAVVSQQMESTSAGKETSTMSEEMDKRLNSNPDPKMYSHGKNKDSYDPQKGHFGTL